MTAHYQSSIWQEFGLVPAPERNPRNDLPARIARLWGLVRGGRAAAAGENAQERLVRAAYADLDDHMRQDLGIDRRRA